MIEPGFVLALFAATGAFLTGLCVARLRARRPMAAARSGMGGGLCLCVAGLLVAVGFNLYTYQRLTFEQPVATLTFERLGPQRFTAEISVADAPARRYELAGDQWQLDARVLKWTGAANLLGLDAHYRLERLTGRYASVDDARRNRATAHRLTADRGLDLWRVAERYPDWLPLVDASYGSATYLPMADGARYTVTITQSGLIARAENEAAEKAARDW